MSQHVKTTIEQRQALEQAALSGDLPANYASLTIAVLHDLSATEQALEDRKTIERAKGILMRRTGSSEQEAYRILQRTSQDRSVAMVEIAKQVLASEPVTRR